MWRLSSSPVILELPFGNLLKALSWHPFSDANSGTSSLILNEKISLDHLMGSIASFSSVVDKEQR